MMASAVVAAALALALALPAVLGDLSPVGPYKAEMETFSTCDGIGSLGLQLDVHLIENEKGEVVYDGNITIPYDLDNEELMVVIRIFRWDSTGGWIPFYNKTIKDFIPYFQETFPEIFDALFGSIGVSGKPMPAGVYHMRNFFPKDIRLGKFAVLPYGRYKLTVFHSLDGADLGCFQVTAIVKQSALSNDPGGVMTYIRRFG